jgi:hypothetical protein
MSIKTIFWQSRKKVRIKTISVGSWEVSETTRQHPSTFTDHEEVNSTFGDSIRLITMEGTLDQLKSKNEFKRCLDALAESGKSESQIS